MAKLNKINSQLRNFTRAANFEKVQGESVTTAINVVALEATQLGKELDENISGFQALNTSAGPATTALLTESLTGLKTTVVKDNSASKTDLDKITGAAVDDGFLDFVVGSPTPEGVKSATKTVAPNITNSQIETIVSNLLPTQLKDVAKQVTESAFIDFAVDYQKTVQTFAKQFSNLIQGETGNILQDILLRTDSTPLNNIERLGVPIARCGEILGLLKIGDIKNAALLAKKYGPAGDLEFYELELAKINVSISSQIGKPVGINNSSLPVFDLRSFTNKWEGKNTNTNMFTLIPTEEELMLDMLNCTREVTELCLFGYEITDSQNITAGNIHDSYIRAGKGGIGFHYVVLPNGNLQRGRPISRIGNHVPEHHNFSIAVCVPHLKDSPATVEQGKTVDAICKAFWQSWPGGQLVDGKEDLGMTVPVGVKTDAILRKFKKVNFGQANRSFTTDQLIAAAQGNL